MEENTSQELLGVGGLGGLYPAVRKYAQCHYNGSHYEHGDRVSPSAFLFVRGQNQQD